ncbi:MAG: hypothetical protein ACYC49_00525 [Ignavibacteriaceae bacterium]
MIKKTEKESQINMFFSLKEMMDQKYPLFILTEEINWQKFDDDFSGLYFLVNGRPALPILINFLHFKQHLFCRSSIIVFDY